MYIVQHVRFLNLKALPTILFLRIERRNFLREQDKNKINFLEEEKRGISWRMLIETFSSLNISTVACLWIPPVACLWITPVSCMWISPVACLWIPILPVYEYPCCLSMNTPVACLWISLLPVYEHPCCLSMNIPVACLWISLLPVCEYPFLLTNGCSWIAKVDIVLSVPYLHISLVASRLPRPIP